MLSIIGYFRSARQPAGFINQPAPPRGTDSRLNRVFTDDDGYILLSPGIAFDWTVIGLGLLLGDRVASSVPVIILALAGAYAGWLLRVIVFSAVRGGNPEEKQG